ncbi:MAG: hypothetical protein IKH49_07765 [Bacteroidales bacterium]|nr:hypothetical protein [Bacteroidales bacterium]
MKRIVSVILIPALLLACNPKKPDGEQGIDPKQAGLVFNEIAAHDEISETDNIPTWVEIINPTTEEKTLDGLSLFLTDEYFSGQNIANLSGKLAPGERKVISTEDESMRTGFSSEKPFTLVLGPDKNHPVTSFERKESDPSLGLFASWQRIPDATGEFRKLTYCSPGRENTVFKLEETLPNAVWAWGSHMGDLLDNDAAKLRNLKDLGYDHLVLNAAAFDNRNYRQQAIRITKIADEIGITIQAWIQCFYHDGDWISPVDDENKCYKEEEFTRIRENARSYVENWGVKGIHLDYIRFGGTAYKHNPTADVTAVGAVNRCCREVREVTDSFDEGLITSAALMPEVNSSYYYGQKPAEMAQWIHILMPMIYRYGSYNFSDKSFKSTSNWFAEQAEIGGGVSWSGIQTYDSATHGMEAEKIRRDIDLMAETKARGIILFRYQLGTFPDVKDIDWNKKSE